MSALTIPRVQITTIATTHGLQWVAACRICGVLANITATGDAASNVIQNLARDHYALWHTGGRG